MFVLYEFFNVNLLISTKSGQSSQDLHNLSKNLVKIGGFWQDRKKFEMRIYRIGLYKVLKGRHVTQPRGVNSG